MSMHRTPSPDPIGRLTIHISPAPDPFPTPTPRAASLARRPYRSRPSWPSARALRVCSSFATRAAAAASAWLTSSRGTHTTPSSSAIIASPGRTIWPPTDTGTLTAPGVSLTVPCALTAADQAGKPMARSSATSRRPASITMPRTPRAASEVASSSPNIPSVDGEVVVTTSRSPARHCSAAAWIMRLSPGQHSTVTAVPPIRAPSWMGRSPGPRYPARPIASCTVATPSPASWSTMASCARGTPVTITLRIR